MNQGDEYWMARAIELSKRGLYTSTPNPSVGCVLVKEGRLIGQGWHSKAGQPHGEIVALNSATESVRGATAYVTLEPCSHTGRTGPCADALIEAGIARVVSALEDPNPQVSGSGHDRLKRAGVEVVTGVLNQSALAVHRGFYSRMSRGRPFVTLKMAVSLDGRIAPKSGGDGYFTCPASKIDVHRGRARSCAILTGRGTVEQDDPRLNVRWHDQQGQLTVGDVWYGEQSATDLRPHDVRQPMRVVLDSTLKTELSMAIYQGDDRRVVVAQEGCDQLKQKAFKQQGVEVWAAPKTAGSGRLDLAWVVSQLADQGVNELWVEAGTQLASAFMASGLVDELLLYQAPVVFGAEGLPLLEQPLSDKQLTLIERVSLGVDQRLRYKVH